MRENIRVAADIRRGSARDEDDPAEVVEQLIDRDRPAAPSPTRGSTRCPPASAASSSSVARLATKPKVLLLDEPASGQDETETERVRGAAPGSSPPKAWRCVLVEHDVQLVMKVCDDLHVLDFGQIIATGTPAEIQSNEAVLAAYLGSGYHR